MISYSEQRLLKNIVKSSSQSLQDIYTLIGKVYDEELALDLNRQAAAYSSMKERASRRLLETGIAPEPLGIVERTRRWSSLQVKTALNVNTGYIAGMLARDEELRLHDMEQIAQENGANGRTGCELADEFMDFEANSIRILKTYADV